MPLKIKFGYVKREQSEYILLKSFTKKKNFVNLQKTDIQKIHSLQQIHLLSIYNLRSLS